MLPQAHLTSHSRMSGSRRVITLSWLSGSWRYFLCSFVYSCHLFLISSFVRSISFLSFIVPIFAWNIPLVSLIFLKRFLVFPTLLFSSISLHWSLRKAFLISPGYSLELCIQMGISFLFSFVFHSLLFSVIWKPSWDNHFAFLHLLFLGVVLITASCTVSCTSIHRSSGTLSHLIPWIYFSLALCKSKGFDRSYPNGLVVFPTFFNLSLNLAIRSSWSEPQSASGLVFAYFIKLPNLWLKRI